MKTVTQRSWSPSLLVHILSEKKNKGTVLFTAIRISTWA